MKKYINICDFIIITIGFYNIKFLNHNYEDRYERNNILYQLKADIQGIGINGE